MQFASLVAILSERGLAKTWVVSCLTLHGAYDDALSVCEATSGSSSPNENFLGEEAPTLYSLESLIAELDLADKGSHDGGDGKL